MALLIFFKITTGRTIVGKVLSGKQAQRTVNQLSYIFRR